MTTYGPQKLSAQTRTMMIKKALADAGFTGIKKVTSTSAGHAAYVTTVFAEDTEAVATYLDGWLMEDADAKDYEGHFVSIEWRLYY